MKQRGINIVLWIILVIALVVGGIWLLNSYSTPRIGREFADEEISTDPDIGVTVPDVLTAPQNYVGQAVTVSSEVENWYNPYAFSLDAPGVINDQLLVITTDPQYAFTDPEVFGDDIWMVSGTVKTFRVAEVETLYGLDLEQEVFVDYETLPYIEASSVTLVAN